MLVAQSCLTLCDPTDCSSTGCSIHEILQARILEWVAFPFSRASSRPRDWTWVFCIADRFFTIRATRLHYWTCLEKTVILTPLLIIHNTGSEKAYTKEPYGLDLPKLLVPETPDTVLNMFKYIFNTQGTDLGKCCPSIHKPQRHQTHVLKLKKKKMKKSWKTMGNGWQGWSWTSKDDLTFFYSVEGSWHTTDWHWFSLTHPCTPTRG